MSEITCIGILAHPLRPMSFPVAEQIRDRLTAKGLQPWLATQWRENDVLEDVQRSHMVIAIGGDGAMLRAARVCAPFSVPVLGINMGNLGFLTEVADPHKWEASVDAILSGNYWIEQRSMLHVTAYRSETTVLAESIALNDIVISGLTTGRIIELDTYIDQDWTTTYYADALVIATATGSTAYALALGGPILPPELSNILIVPAAPHLSMDRPIVISEGSEVKVISSGNADVLVQADGTTIARLHADDYVIVRASDHDSRFIRLRSRNYFYRSLLDRLEPRVQRRRQRNQM
ncbi:MAG: NAD(+)/NADH kinase [Anaerolineae bacterium]